MSSAPPTSDNGPGRNQAAALWTVVAVFGLLYVVLLGGTQLGELMPWLRLVNTVLAGCVITAYVLIAPGRADRVDIACIASLLVFMAAALVSEFPRQSLDGAMGALTYTAAFFLIRRTTFHRHGRDAVTYVLIALSVVLTVAAAASWLPPTLEWWSLTGWSVTPPLDMNRSGLVWGHRHDLALMIAVTYPAWWVGRPSALRAAAATVFGILGLLVIAVDGSRTVWLAIAVAGGSVGAAAVVGRWRPTRRSLLLASAGTVALAAVAAGSGLAAAALDRFLTTNTLVSRADMWRSATEVWLERPLTGAGPGSFPWLLQGTDYFDANSWAPRHPDSLPFQLLPEVGLLGVIAVAIVLAYLGPSVFRAHWPAKLALVAWAVSSIGSNPTEFAFLMFVAIAWAAYAVPATEPMARLTKTAPTWVRLNTPQVASLGLISVLAIAYASMTVAAFAHEDARAALGTEDYGTAARQLRVAETFDPGMALYPRLLAGVHVVSGDPADGVAGAERALALNPNDDLAWRTLVLAELALGDEAAALVAMDRAIGLQRSDSTNLLLRLWIERAVDGRGSATTAAQILHAWPWLVADRGWAEILPAPITSEALAAAAVSFERGDPAPQSNAVAAIWLVTLADRWDLLTPAVEQSGLTISLGQAYASLIRCEDAGGHYLRMAPSTDRRFDEYWTLRVREGNLLGVEDTAAVRALQIMTGRAPATIADVREKLNPLDENGPVGLSADTFGYRRLRTTWPDAPILLPSIDSAFARWLVEPGEAARASDLEAVAGCR